MLSKEEVKVALLLRDFRAFLIYTWNEVGLPKPTKVQLDMAEWLMNTNINRKGIMAYRGVGKSWITCAYAVWRLLKNIDEKVLIVSAGEGKALENAHFIHRLIDTMDICSELRGGERDSVKSFDVKGCKPAQAPSVRTVGITGQMAGLRSSLLIADDVEVPNNSYSQLQREKLGEMVKEFEAILMPGGSIVYLGTPQTEESLYNILRRERGYQFRIWTARLPLLAKLPSYYGDLAPVLLEMYEQGFGEWTPTDPCRFDDENLSQRELSYGKSGFALQFMLDTDLADGQKYPLKLRESLVVDVDATSGAPTKLVWSNDKRCFIDELINPGLTGDGFYRPMFIDESYLEFESVGMSIDPSGRGEDETAYAIGGQLYGRIFILEVGGLASGDNGFSDEVVDHLLTSAKRWGVNEITVETNGGLGMFTKILQSRMDKVYRCSVEEVTQHRNKEQRIVDILEPLFNQHKIVFNREVVLNDSNVKDIHMRLMYQITRMTRERGALKHDDRVDALAELCLYFLNSIARDSDTAHQHKLDREFWEEVKAVNEAGSRTFIEGVSVDVLIKEANRNLSRPVGTLSSWSGMK